MLPARIAWAIGAGFETSVKPVTGAFGEVMISFITAAVFRAEAGRSCNAKRAG
jgi:hypothetical protein